jgi:transglutaminase-like putative cysteine protease
VRQKAISVVFFIFLLNFLPTAVAASVPDWVKNLAQQPAKHYADDVDAVTLLDEAQTTVKDNGEIVTQARIAYRILRPEGKSYAKRAVSFDNETKINYLHGWSITAKGQEYEAKEKDALEISATSFEIYSDEKAKILLLPGADVGTVVAFEYEHKRRPYLFQDGWYIQSEIPVEKSRYVLQLPPSWEYRADWVNHAEVAPVISGNSYTWELTDVPRIEKEFNRPPALALASRIIITFFSEKIKNQAYKSWAELGAWHAQLIVGTHESSPALQQKVQELAPATLPLLERVRALARFAQHDIRYAAIEIGIGGWRPHPAPEIFAHRYGDCKDKATLLATMLAQIGVKSYYMPIYDERGIYTKNSPPYIGFNHAILVIQLPDGSFTKSFPALYEHPKLGHLVIFDPTNEWVPFGQLPFYEQDNYALLVTENGGELIHLPVSSPELNELKRNAKLKLLPDGTLQGEIEEVRSGYHAMMERAYLQEETQRDRKKMIEHFLGATLGNFQVDSFEVVNEGEIDKDLILKYKFTADHYAKNAGPLLLVRPRVVGENAGRFDATKPRHYPYEFHAPFVDSDTVEIALPEGFKVDELPDPANANFPFAQYVSKTETAGNVLKYTREYKMTTTLVPVDDMSKLQRLFSEIITDEKSMAVLKRAN